MLLNCYRTVSMIRKELLGRFGDAPGGFHSATMDQFAYLRTFGTRLETVDLLSVMDTFSSGSAKGCLGEATFTDADVRATMDEMRAGRPCLIDDDYLARGARLYHALRAHVQANGFTSIAMKCWPELDKPGRDLISCFPITWLMTKGDVRAAACESDCGSAVLQSMAALLTGTPAACLDFVNYTGRCSCVELGHCGVGIVGQMGDGEAIAYKSPDRQGGAPHHAPALIGQFAYGPKTGMTITQGPDGAFKMLVFTGESSPTTAQGKKYSAADILLPRYRELSSLILEHGFPHHLAVAMRDITTELAEVCAVLGIECFNPGTSG
jgi:L-fucose isomerase-like protein